MNWLKEIIAKLTPCNHQYVVVGKDDMYECRTSSSNSYPIGRKYTFICQKCGKLKVQRDY